MRTEATRVASRPRILSVASTTYQECWCVLALATNEICFGPRIGAETISTPQTQVNRTTTPDYDARRRLWRKSTSRIASQARANHVGRDWRVTSAAANHSAAEVPMTKVVANAEPGGGGRGGRALTGMRTGS